MAQSGCQSSWGEIGTEEPGVPNDPKKWQRVVQEKGNNNSATTSGKNNSWQNTKYIPGSRVNVIVFISNPDFVPSCFGLG